MGTDLCQSGPSCGELENAIPNSGPAAAHEINPVPLFF